MEKIVCRNFVAIIGLVITVFFAFTIFSSEDVSALSYDGEDLALAILANQSTLVSSSYTDTDKIDCRQGIVLSSLGSVLPTDGPTFALFGTGVAGTNIVTTNADEPGDERGTWFKNQHGHPRDSATLTMALQVPLYMHYIYYDAQFFSAEYPEYVGTQYNDKLTITIYSPSKGTSTYIFDVNSGYFVLDSNDLTNTGFDIFAMSGDPSNIDQVDTNPRTPGADAGASDVIPIGGETHPVSPNEQITVTISMTDTGDNLFDSAAFIDNLRFTGYAKTDITARKVARDIYGELIDEPVECGSTIRYSITLSNTGTADQNNNPGNEFEDYIPNNATYVPGSVTATSGVIGYDSGENKIIWNGNILAESSRVLSFDVVINETGLETGAIVSNQGTVYWDSNEDGTNDATELTDDHYTDDGVDQDGDGFTDDDDPTIVSVVVFEPPLTVTEDFSDDVAGEIASQSYLTRSWFETSQDMLGSIFEVAPTYYYSTIQSFKTKLRLSGSPQYWYYNLSNLESDINSWEIWFKCGNVSEESDLCLEFKNEQNNSIAKLKFEYVRQGIIQPTDWILELYYWNPSTGWNKLYSDFSEGYLYNSWYKLKIEKNSNPSYINYHLYREDDSYLVDYKTDLNLGTAFSNLDHVRWSSTKNPIACPMFFWDEHILGLE